MGRKSKKLGRALIRNKRKRDMKKSARHTNDAQEEDNRLESIIEQNDLEEFFNYAQVKNKSFAEGRDKVTMMVDDIPTTFHLDGEDGEVKKEDRENAEHFLNEDGTIPLPRRPAWNRKMTKQELHAQEKEAFLNWRRKLAALEETHDDLILTPFEKNLNVWKQLWRTVERSHVLIQIVDARNPLFYRCCDLEAYVKEVSPKKRNVLLVNKSDYLNDKQRRAWKAYLDEKNIEFIFFSAKNEEEKIYNTKEALEESDMLQFDDIQIDTEWEDPRNKDPIHIFNREELLVHFKTFLAHSQPVTNRQDEGRVVIGMAGFPNVGKSSVINILSGLKRVSVGSTPGKTKHIQTIPIGKAIMLCDCPGLVFPLISTTKQDMVCDGVLPIDQLRDHRPPLALICQRIPIRILEMTYGMKFPFRASRYTKLDHLIMVFCKHRGLLSHKGVPNVGAAARKLLKDYVSGKLLYCHPPPNWEPTQEEFVLDLEIQGADVEDMTAEEIQEAIDDEQESSQPNNQEEEGEDEWEDIESDESFTDDEGDIQGQTNHDGFEEEEEDEEEEPIAPLKDEDEYDKKHLLPIVPEIDYSKSSGHYFNINNVTQVAVQERYEEKQRQKKTKEKPITEDHIVQYTESGQRVVYRISELKRRIKNEKRKAEVASNFQAGKKRISKKYGKRHHKQERRYYSDVPMSELYKIYKAQKASSTSQN